MVAQHPFVNAATIPAWEASGSAGQQGNEQGGQQRGGGRQKQTIEERRARDAARKRAKRAAAKRANEAQDDGERAEGVGRKRDHSADATDAQARKRDADAKRRRRADETPEQAEARRKCNAECSAACLCDDDQQISRTNGQETRTVPASTRVWAWTIVCGAVTCDLQAAYQVDDRL